MIKTIIICADDYSQNEVICEGIILLAKEKRINAISCLVNSKHWSETHNELDQVRENNYIGLHLNFTLGQAVSNKWRQRYTKNFPSHSSLLQKSYLKQLDRACVEAEIHAQIDAFSEATGNKPDFIDGHQHIHQLPTIRESLVAVYKQKQLTAFCRNTSNSRLDFLTGAGFPKRQAISLLGGVAFKRLLRQHAISANSSFEGIYNFAKIMNYNGYFKQFLKRSHTGGLIMCHPGVKSSDATDPLYQYRHHELDYFMSTDFHNDLNNNQCRLAQKKI